MNLKIRGHFMNKIKKYLSTPAGQYQALITVFLFLSAYAGFFKISNSPTNSTLGIGSYIISIIAGAFSAYLYFYIKKPINDKSMNKVVEIVVKFCLVLFFVYATYYITDGLPDEKIGQISKVSFVFWIANLVTSEMCTSFENKNKVNISISNDQAIAIRELIYYINKYPHKYNKPDNIILLLNIFDKIIDINENYKIGFLSREISEENLRVLEKFNDDLSELINERQSKRRSDTCIRQNL